MELKEIQEKVNNLFIEDFEIEETLIKPEAHLKNDLGIDSLDFVDIVAIIDREFGFKPVLQELKEIATLKYFESISPFWSLYLETKSTNVISTTEETIESYFCFA